MENASNEESSIIETICVSEKKKRRACKSQASIGSHRGESEIAHLSLVPLLGSYFKKSGSSAGGV